MTCLLASWTKLQMIIFNPFKLFHQAMKLKVYWWQRWSHWISLHKKILWPLIFIVPGAYISQLAILNSSQTEFSCNAKVHLQVVFGSYFKACSKHSLQSQENYLIPLSCHKLHYLSNNVRCIKANTACP